MQARWALIGLGCFLANMAAWAAAQTMQPEIVLQTGHTGGVTAVALHPDGKHVLTGANDGSAILWDLAAGLQLRTYRGGPLGNGYEAQAALLEMKLPRTFPMGASAIPAVHSLQFSRDGGRFLMVCAADNLKDLVVTCCTATVWETATGRLLRRIELGQEIETAILSPDGSLVIGGGFPLDAEEAKAMAVDGFKIEPAMAGVVWDVESGRKLQPFAGFKTEILAGRFMPDGRRLVLLCGQSSEEDRQSRAAGAAPKPKLPQDRATFVAIWEVPAMKEVQRFAAGMGMQHLELSPQGDRILLSAEPHAGLAAEVWDLKTQKPLCSAPCKLATLANEGRQLITVDEKGLIQVRDLPDGKNARTLAAKAPGAKALAAAADGSRLIVGTQHDLPEPGVRTTTASCSPGEALVLDLAKGDVLATFTARRSAADFLAVSPSGRYLLIGDCLWDTGSGVMAAALCNEPVQCFEAAFSPDEKRLATTNHPAAKFFDFSGIFGSFGTPDKTVLARIVDLPSGRELLRLETKGKVKDWATVNFDATGSHLVTVANRGVVTAWDATQGKLIRQTTIEGKFIVVATSPNGRLAAAFHVTETPVWWDLRRGKQVSAKGHKPLTIRTDGSPRGMSRDGKRRIEIAVDGLSATLSDADRPTIPLTLKPDLQKGENISAADFDAKSEQFAFTMVSKPISRVWDAVTGQPVRDLEVLDMSSIETAALSPDGKLVAAGGTDGRVAIWNVETGKLSVQLAYDGPVMSLRLSEDGRRLVVGCADRTAAVTRLDTKATSALLGHEGAVSDAMFAGNGKFLVTVSREDGTARLWDAQQNRQLARLVSLNDRKDWLVITPEGWYDGSEGGRRAIMYRVGKGQPLAPGNQVAPPRHRPGLLGKLWRGESP